LHHKFVTPHTAKLLLVGVLKVSHSGQYFERKWTSLEGIEEQ
jgi:hypothetical protein